MLFVLFIGILLWISIIDIRKHIIPDKLLLLAVTLRVVHFVCFEGKPWQALAGLLLEAMAVSIPLLIVVYIVEKILGKELLGGGDIKLLFVTGMYLGWEQNLWALLIACIIGLVAGYAWLNRRVENKQSDVYFSFGPFIALGAIIILSI